MIQVEHPSFGSIKGVQKDGVVQYLGFPYATLENRFAEPVLKESYEASELDATTTGYTAWP